MFDLDRSLPTPLPAQIVAGMRGLVANGQLAAGDRVPSTRELARQLTVSRGSVVTAYDQLIAEGILVAAQGAPTIVHPELPAVKATPVPPRPAGVRARRGPELSLKPTSGHAGTIRQAAWRKAWREAADADREPVDKAGQPGLRWAVAEHLRLARGMTVNPDSVLVTGGSREGLLLILMSLGRGLRVGVEDPGHPGLRRIIPMAGHQCVDCVTDRSGVVVEKLPGDLDAVLVTPSHRYPLGGAMPAARRTALAEWARETSTVVVEDDYFAELRYRHSPHPPLAAMAPGAPVLALGTFSTLLSTRLSAGYVIADPINAPLIRATREVLGMPVSPVTQAAIAALLNGGHARRNSRTVHTRLARRKQVLGDDLIPALTACGATVSEGPGPLSTDLAVSFNTSVGREWFAGELDSRGVEFGTIDGGESIHLSFGHLSDEDFTRAVDVLTRVGAESSPH
ncbi:PLP-dependent aminotransferase family protein [Corynebacterium sp.]|uniref:MocR-like pyridoxine biosynthesis transcription factor PdxR n=1 Tax=Corynebacterium sp. TaxID=1720 RepID=UPI002A9168FC|nr:PLP-dependent aminotransferase family protein [Corynebacterium sp.]MDY5785728.1 PLP-dependent aminotransferase family protein [Corynebacterium sp.]